MTDTIEKLQQKLIKKDNVVAQYQEYIGELQTQIDELERYKKAFLDIKTVIDTHIKK
jgi:hypothetical protein